MSSFRRRGINWRINWTRNGRLSTSTFDSSLISISIRLLYLHFQYRVLVYWLKQLLWFKLAITHNAKHSCFVRNKIVDLSDYPEDKHLSDSKTSFSLASWFPIKGKIARFSRCRLGMQGCRCVSCVNTSNEAEVYAWQKYGNANGINAVSTFDS
jgi:hypothetical protein